MDLVEEYRQCEASLLGRTTSLKNEVAGTRKLN